ncbi:hypothetical protein ES703_108041 [subsurface metagenome]
MIAIDWSHTKGFTAYDGTRVSVLDKKALLKRLAGGSIHKLKSKSSVNPASGGASGESNKEFYSRQAFNPPAPLIILEQGCPLSLVYDILKTGCEVHTINTWATQDYRVKHKIEKSDENDAKIIYELANKGAKLIPVSFDDKEIQLLELYQRYKRYQKARVAMTNMRKAHVRQFGDGLKSNIHLKSSGYVNNPSPDCEGDGESTLLVKSSSYLNPSPATEGEGESTLNIQSNLGFNPSLSDGTLPYDIGIDTLKAAENGCLKKLVKLAPPVPQALKIKGLGPRLWAGIYITANPTNFPRLSSYLRYCGLVDKKQLGTKWNRHARMLYHMLADEVMKLRDEKFRPIYDQCKADIAGRYPEYTKIHIHNAALNRTATFLAKKIYLLGGNLDGRS